MRHATFFLTPSQYEWLSRSLPQPAARTGRPALGNRKLLPGIVFVLKTGCRWQDIPPHLCRHGYASCWRRLRYWQERGALHTTWQAALDELERRAALDPLVSHLDGSLVQAPRWREATGYSGKHRRFGTTVSLLTDYDGTPLSAVLTAGNRNDVFSAAATLLKLRVSRSCQVGILNADKGYDSDQFRVFLAREDVVANIPPRRLVGCWAVRHEAHLVFYEPAVASLGVRVERTIAWLNYYRRLRYRWERSLAMFQACVDLACILTCLRKVEF